MIRNRPREALPRRTHTSVTRSSMSMASVPRPLRVNEHSDGSNSRTVMVREVAEVSCRCGPDLPAREGLLLAVSDHGPIDQAHGAGNDTGRATIVGVGVGVGVGAGVTVSVGGF